MTKSKEEILMEHTKKKYDMSPNSTDSVAPDVYAAMEEYAKDQMITLLRNMAANPVSVYSQKVKGQEKQFFLGHNYVEDLIKRLNQ